MEHYKNKQLGDYLENITLGHYIKKEDQILIEESAEEIRNSDYDISRFYEVNKSLEELPLKKGNPERAKHVLELIIEYGHKRAEKAFMVEKTSNKDEEEHYGPLRKIQDKFMPILEDRFDDESFP